MRWTASDRRFLIIVTTVLLLATLLPYFLARWQMPTGRIPTDVYYLNTGDWNVYYSAIEQVRHGHWLVKNAFTTSDDRAVYFLPAFIVAGVIARATGLTAPTAFQLARLLLIPLLVYLGAEVFRRLSPGQSWRWGLLLFLFAGGFGRAAGLTDLTPFVGLLYSPHYVLARLLFFWIVLLLLPGGSDRGVRLAWLAIAETLLLLTIPYAGIVAFVMIAVDLLIVRRQLMAFFKLVLLLMPIFLYQGILSLGAVAQNYLKHNTILTLTPSQFFLGIVPLLLLALVGRRHWRTVPTSLLVIAGLTFVWGLFALPNEHRFLFGLSLPLALLAGTGVSEIVRWLRRRLGQAPDWLAPLSVGLGSLLIAGWAAFTIGWKFVNTRAAYAMTADQAAVLDWIETQTPEQAHVLSDYTFSNYIAGKTGRSVYVGHGVQSPNADLKSAKVEALMTGVMPTTLAEQLISQERIQYIVASTVSRGLPLVLGRYRLTPAFHNTTLTVYQVAR